MHYGAQQVGPGAQGQLHHAAVREERHGQDAQHRLGARRVHLRHQGLSGEILNKYTRLNMFIVDLIR